MSSRSSVDFGDDAQSTAVVTIVEVRHLPEALAETAYVTAVVNEQARRTDVAEGADTYWGAQFAFFYQENTTESARTLRVELREESPTADELTGLDEGVAPLATADIDLRKRWTDNRWVDLVAEPAAAARGFQSSSAALAGRGALASLSLECVTIPPVGGGVRNGAGARRTTASTAATAGVINTPTARPPPTLDTSTSPGGASTATAGTPAPLSPPRSYVPKSRQHAYTSALAAAGGRKAQVPSAARGARRSRSGSGGRGHHVDAVNTSAFTAMASSADERGGALTAVSSIGGVDSSTGSVGADARGVQGSGGGGGGCDATPRSDGADSNSRSLSPIYTARSTVTAIDSHRMLPSSGDAAARLRSTTTPRGGSVAGTLAAAAAVAAATPRDSTSSASATAALQDVLVGLRHVYSSVPEEDAALRRQIELLMERADRSALKDPPSSALTALGRKGASTTSTAVAAAGRSHHARTSSPTELSRMRMGHVGDARGIDFEATLQPRRSSSPPVAIALSEPRDDPDDVDDDVDDMDDDDAFEASLRAMASAAVAQERAQQQQQRAPTRGGTRPVRPVGAMSSAAPSGATAHHHHGHNQPSSRPTSATTSTNASSAAHKVPARMGRGGAGGAAGGSAGVRNATKSVSPSRRAARERHGLRTTSPRTRAERGGAHGHAHHPPGYQRDKSASRRSLSCADHASPAAASVVSSTSRGFASRRSSSRSRAGSEDGRAPGERSTWRPPPNIIDASLVVPVSPPHVTGGAEVRTSSPQAAVARAGSQRVSKPVTRRSASGTRAGRLANGGSRGTHTAPGGGQQAVAVRSLSSTHATPAAGVGGGVNGTVRAGARKATHVGGGAGRAAGPRAVGGNVGIEVNQLHRAAGAGGGGRVGPTTTAAAGPGHAASTTSRPLIPLREVRPVEGHPRGGADDAAGAQQPTPTLLRALGTASRLDPSSSIHSVRSAPGGVGVGGGVASANTRMRGGTGTASRYRNATPPAERAGARGPRAPPPADNVAAGSTLVRTFGSANPSASLSSVTSTRTAPGGGGSSFRRPSPLTTRERSHHFRGARQQVAAERTRDLPTSPLANDHASIYVPVPTNPTSHGGQGSFSRAGGGGAAARVAEHHSLSRVRAVGKSRQEHADLLTGLVTHRPRDIACESELSFEDLEALVNSGLE